MNKSSPLSPASAGPLPQQRRVTRAPAAARACEACRRRKLKCDEGRPTCTHCRNRSETCEYSLPVPEQISQATSDILEGITRLEDKFDSFAQTHSLSPVDGGSRSNASLSAVRSETAALSSSGHSGENRFGTAIPNTTSGGPPSSSASSVTGLAASLPDALSRSRPLTVPHSILLWPAVHDYLIHTGVCSASDLADIVQDGTSWFIQLELGSQLSILSPQFRLATESSPSGLTAGIIFPELTLDRMLAYTEAYFNTFNVIFPILSSNMFERDVLNYVVRQGFIDGDSRAVVALFVFALGAVAIEGTSPHPITTSDGKPSGIRGRSARQPPGLAIFNEGRRRLGTMAVAYTLEKVQALLLQSLYFECSACHVEFWHSLTAAAMACQVLMRCQSDWASPRGDMVKRAYWTCVINEEFFHIDLDLPKTGIASMEDHIPLPHFHEAQNRSYAAGFPAEQRLEWNLSIFLALIALRRLITRIHALLQESDGAAFVHYGGARVDLLGVMAQQLVMWRNTLPIPLQWLDTEDEQWMASSPSASDSAPVFVDTDGSLALPGDDAMPDLPTWQVDGDEEFRLKSTQAPPPMASFDHFTQPDGEQSKEAADVGSPPTGHGYNLDIVTATLQTRFYYARFMVHLPFVYKVLHSPHDLTVRDTENCVTAIRSACDWPLSMSPTRNKKRLVPHLFAWTQNFIGTLLILEMTVTNPDLHAVCEGRISRDAVALAKLRMLDWIHDMKQIDNMAQWGWRILNPLFKSTAR